MSKKLINTLIILVLVSLTLSRVFYFNYMEDKTISNETLERVKTLPRIDYVAFQLLVTQNQVKRFIKFKKARTIFFDENDGFFYYLNPYHLELHKCGEFIEEGGYNG